MTTVTGPLMSPIVFFVYRLTSDRTSVVLPTCILSSALRLPLARGNVPHSDP